MSPIEHPITAASRLALLAAFGLSAVACDDLLPGESITGSGDLVTETYDLVDFTNVDVGYAFDAAIARADGFSVAITVDDNIRENVDVRLDGDTLRIGMKGNDSYRNVTMDAAITMPALDKLKLSGASTATFGSFESSEPLRIELDGASRVDCSDITSESTVFDLEGASKADCRDVATGETKVALQGASSLTLTGSGGNADISGKGASKADLGGLPVANATVKLEGASDATVNTDGMLDVDLAGGSDVRYLGEPTLGDVKMGGDSTLERGS
jgi:hypothetical protein